MKRIYWVLASITTCLLASCNSSTKDAREYQTVKIDTVTSANGQTYLQYPGKVKAAQDISLAFRVNGTIRKIYVKDGARVQAGQLLAELDPTDYQVQLDATEAEYKQIKAEAERVMALYKENGTTPSANDKAVYGLKQITAKYQHHKDQLGYTRLYAPFNGYIPEVEINLPAAEYIRREQFNQYHCTFDIYPDRSYPLKLISVTPKANANQLYTMRLQLVADKQPVPSPGMNTMVTIRCDSDDTHSMSVPCNAILQKDGKAGVFVYTPSDNKVSRREVTIVRLMSDGRCIITSDELKPGELVVFAGIHHIQNGETVKPLPAASKTNIGGLL